jgi:superfamily I DNA/RNA helicase/mRNA-degrading endonuclease RelE of RelBE toxin-antitoxin system
MQFLIADTFTDSLARLSGEEQKAAKTTSFDLQLNPANPGHSFHRLDRARDKNFWSVRVNMDIRIIAHRTDASLLLCYVDHHDKAYKWAENRKLEVHPKTGAAQIIEVRETVQDIKVPNYVADDNVDEPKKKPLEGFTAEQLHAYGVPEDWIQDVLNADEDELLRIADHLPAEAAEALLELATGGMPQPRQPQKIDINPFEHPDAQRRFRVMDNVEELERALEYPWDKWTVFLHPSQRETVGKNFNGPARVSGSAGTGKTIVALHRVVFLARTNPDARLLLTTFSDTLANALKANLRRLISNEPRLAERIDVVAIESVAKSIYERRIGSPKIAGQDQIRDLISSSKLGQASADNFSERFLMEEWSEIVDAWQISSWDEYRDVRRLGRKTRLPESKRADLWAVFEKVNAALNAQSLVTNSGLFSRLAADISAKGKVPYDFVVVDESQDLTISQIKFFAAIAGQRPNALFFAGDLGQRIFQTPFSWGALGVEIRGRSQTLKINYRTSHQIRRQADRLLAPEVSDVDGNIEDRRGTVSVFNGPEPAIQTFESESEESLAVARWLSSMVDEGMSPHEIGIFVRSEDQIDRAITSIEGSGIPFQVLDRSMQSVSGKAKISTMHLAKGLEFRAVAVMACDDEVLPLQSRIETVVDDADLEEVYDTERHLLYVASTRARERLMVSGVNPASEFLDDLVLR